jgi:hypothetical protein
MEGVINMRIIKLGIFSVVTVLLLTLSLSPGVTAAAHTETLVELGSYVDTSTPRASVNITPRDDVWSYSNWNWTVDVNSGDTVTIDTDWEWENYQTGGSPTGKHDFSVTATYRLIPRTEVDSDATGPPLIESDYLEKDSGTLTVSFSNVDPGAVITIVWYVYAENTVSTDTADNEQTGYVTLT